MARIFLLKLGLVICLALTCANASFALSTNSATHYDGIKITIRDLGRGDIRVTYHLPSSIKFLPLPGSQAALRKSQWSIHNNHAKLQTNGVALMPISKATRSLSILVHGTSTSPDRVYPILIAETDGSVVLNTGAFVPESSCASTRITFIPMEDGYVVAKGRLFNHRVTIITKCSRPYKGFYAYMGKQQPDVSSSYVLVSDPGAPAWITKTIASTAGVALDTYRNWIHKPTRHNPSIFITFGRGESGRSWWHGDVLSYDSVRLTFVGDAWLKPDPYALETIRRFIAHEAFHFWNGNIKKSDDESNDTWLLEGGAELAATFLLADNGWDDPISTEEYISRNLDLCVLQSLNHTWIEIPNVLLNGKIFYTCGVTFNYMAALAKDLQAPAEGFATIWRKLLSRKTQNFSSSSQYSADEFFHECYSESLDAKLCNLMERSIHGRNTTLSNSIQNFLDYANIPYDEFSVKAVKRSSKPTNIGSNLVNFKNVRDTLLKGLLYINLGRACHGSHEPIGYLTKSNLIYLDIPNSCRNIINLATVEKIAGIKYMEHPIESYNAAVRQCQHKHYLLLESNKGHTAKLTCYFRLKLLPNLLSLKKYKAVTSRLN